MIPLKALGLVKEIQGLSSNFQTQPLLTYQIDPPRICATKKNIYILKKKKKPPRGKCETCAHLHASHSCISSLVSHT